MRAQTRLHWLKRIGASALRPPFDVIEQLPGGAGGAFCIAAGNAREKSSDPVPVELEDKAFAAQSNCPESAIVIEGDDEA